MASPATPSSSPAATITVRAATCADEPALRALAALDSRRPLAGPALVAERDGRLVAAAGLTDRRAIADPFARSADLVAMLKLRADTLGG